MSKFESRKVELTPGKQFGIRRTAVLALAASIGAGIVLVVISFAAGSFAVIEPETGALSGPSTILARTDASGGKLVKFGGGAAAPPPPAPAPSTPPPASSGWPTSTNTGVPIGTNLAAYTGTKTITADNTIIDTADISGCLTIQAHNVVIRKSRMRGACNPGNVYLPSPPAGTAIYSVTITDTEIDGLSQAINGTPGGSTPSTANVGGGGAVTCVRCNLHGAANGIRNSGGVLDLRDSFIHDLVYYKSATAGVSDNGTHNQNLLNLGYAGSSWNIQHNSMENPIGQTSVISMFGNAGNVGNVTLNNNLLNGGGYTVYGGCLTQKPYSSGFNVVITNNRFRRSPTGGFRPKGGSFGPITGKCQSGINGNLWANNVWDDDGSIIP